MKVLAAMSGGVDSAVAAARARDAGHDVTGVHFALSADPAAEREGSRGCCTLSDARDARRAADALGIPFYVWDLAATFAQTVVEDFLNEYAAGRTPNPCVRCNERIKFAALLDKAVALGFDAVATGHHARIVQHGGVRFVARGEDMAKDQSYVVHMLPQRELARTLFPIGHLAKAEVRRRAQHIPVGVEEVRRRHGQRRTTHHLDALDVRISGTRDHRLEHLLAVRRRGVMDDQQAHSIPLRRRRHQHSSRLRAYVDVWF